jgi:uncharacterized protein (TIGR00661 family)
MKVLYAIQATGNGHISRANEIIPFLEQKCELDILVSGTEADIDLNHFIKYRRKGLSFVFGKKGGIDFYKTLKQLQSKKFLAEIKDLPVEDYDLVINDFEPISAWACKIKNVPCMAMSHQYAVLHKNAPKPLKADPLSWLVLRYYAPCKQGVGFHFKNYGDDIFTPVIRKEIRNAQPKNMRHYTVYLPAYDEKKLVKVLSEFKEVQWHIFSKRCKKAYAVKNCLVRPVNTFDFTGSFTTCEGILCGAGFETPAEAMYMGKKLFTIPMKSQYEQQCNAAAIKEFDIPVIKSLKEKHYKKIAAWLEEEPKAPILFEDETDKVIDYVLSQGIKNNIGGATATIRDISDMLSKDMLVAEIG